MYSNNSNGSCAAWARGFAALFAMLAMELALAACPTEANKLLARSLAITLGTEKIAGLDMPDREREQEGGYLPARAG